VSDGDADAENGSARNGGGDVHRWYVSMEIWSASGSADKGVRNANYGDPLWGSLVVWRLDGVESMRGQQGWPRQNLRKLEVGVASQ
jgi:hypothetical protein